MCIEYIKIERSICSQAYYHQHAPRLHSKHYTALTRFMLTKMAHRRWSLHAICVARSKRAPIIGRIYLHTHFVFIYCVVSCIRQMVCVCLQRAHIWAALLFIDLIIRLLCFAVWSRCGIYLQLGLSSFDVYIHADTRFRNVECLRDI